MSITRSPCLLTSITYVCPLQDRSRMPTPTPLRPAGRRLSGVSCTQKSNDGGGGGGGEPTPLLMDRRDVLVALGGLYGAAGKRALANPVVPPDLSRCHPASADFIPPDSPLLKCCPPYSAADIVDYTFPKTPLRVRRPAQDVINDEEYMEKYTAAVRAMKGLDKTDPWNYIQQAKVHCAYCNDAYYQVGYSEPPNQASLQVHGSWFFPPWHRYYLHFYERILGKLIDDDTFALPYWNFDTPEGMLFPSIFTDTKSPLYDANRNMAHMPPAVLDYQNSISGDRPIPDNEIIKQNLAEMRSAFVNSLSLPELFMGDPLRAGEKYDTAKATGRLENIHNAVHQWVGQNVPPYLDMGVFATAARDSVFFCLHANVDRLWHQYRTLRGNRVEFDDTDWLDSTFIFYDENRQVVRVKVRDSFKLSNFCYTYEEVPNPWWYTRVPRKKTAETKTKTELALVPVTEFGSEPRKLESTIRVLVPRPKRNRTKVEKEDKVEVLFIKGIQLDTAGPARFDVYVAKPYGDLAGPSNGDLVGSFVKLPHAMETEMTTVKGKPKSALLKLGLTVVVEDLEADDAEKLVVSLVPRNGDVTVGGIAIKLVQTDSTT